MIELSKVAQFLREEKECNYSVLSEHFQLDQKMLEYVVWYLEKQNYVCKIDNNCGQTCIAACQKASGIRWIAT